MHLLVSGPREYYDRQVSSHLDNPSPGYNRRVDAHVNREGVEQAYATSRGLELYRTEGACSLRKHPGRYVMVEGQTLGYIL